VDITRTVSYPELFWEVIAVMGLLVCWRLSALTRCDLHAWHGNLIWRRVLGTRLRNARLRLATFCGFVWIGALFMAFPPPVLPEIALAITLSAATLLAMQMCMLWGAVMDSIDRRFIIRFDEFERGHATDGASTGA
jgi:hypothetical protein